MKYVVFLLTGAVTGRSEFFQRQLSVSLTNVMCHGTESALTDCDSVRSSVCIGGFDADILCQGECRTLWWWSW